MENDYLESTLIQEMVPIYLGRAIAKGKGLEFIKNLAIVFESEKEKCVKSNTSPKECLKGILETVQEMTMTRRSIQFNPLNHEQSK